MMLTIVRLFAGQHVGDDGLHHEERPAQVVAMCASNSSGVVSSRVPREVSPAALPGLSTRPYSASTVRTHACTAATSDTSQGT